MVLSLPAHTFHYIPFPTKYLCILVMVFLEPDRLLSQVYCLSPTLVNSSAVKASCAPYAASNLFQLSASFLETLAVRFSLSCLGESRSC